MFVLRHASETDGIHHMGRHALILLFAITGAQVASAYQAFAQSADVPPACTLEEIDRSYVVDDEGRFLFVEPQIFAPTDSGFVIVGHPSYAWRFDGERRHLEARDPVFGVHVVDGRVQSIPSPPGMERVHWVRGVASRSGDLTVLLEEERTDTTSRLHRGRIVPARWSAGTWQISDEIEDPPFGPLLELALASRSIPTPDSLAFDIAMQTREGPPEEMLLAVGSVRDGAWEARPVAAGWAESVGIVRDPSGSMSFAVSGHVPGSQPFVRGVRIGQVDEPDSVHVVFTAERGEEIRNLMFVPGPAGAQTGFQVLRNGPPTAWVGGASHGHPTTLVGSDVHYIQGVPRRDKPPVWLTRDSDGDRDYLRASILSDGELVQASLPYPFTAIYAATEAQDGALVLTGAEAELDGPNPYVRSLLIRLSLDCT